MLGRLGSGAEERFVELMGVIRMMVVGGIVTLCMKNGL